MIYYFGWSVCRFVLWLFVPLRTRGRELVPRRGRVILAANHRSYIDPLLLAVCFRRRVTFLSKAIGYRFPLARFFFSRLGVIALREQKGSPGMKQALKYLRENRPLVIFPEGTRNLTRRPFLPGKPGVALLADATGAPVVPIYLEGTDRALPPRARMIRRRPARIVFGKPIYYRGGEYGDFARRVMAEIAGLARS